MKSIKTFLALTLVCGLQTVGLAAPTTASPASDLGWDYKLSANPNGPWTYGAIAHDGTFAKFTGKETTPDDKGALAEVWFNPENRRAAIFHNPADTTMVTNGGDGQHPPDSIWFDTADPDQRFTVARFIVPAKGEYNIKAAFEKVQTLGGNQANVHVFINGIGVFTATIDRGGRAAKFNSTLTLQSRDRVDFAVGDAGDGSYGDTVFVDATLRATKGN